MSPDLIIGALGLVLGPILGFVIGRNDRYVTRNELVEVSRRIDMLQSRADTLGQYLLNQKMGGGS